MTTLGFGVITRNKDAQGLDKLLQTVAPYVDHVYVTVADKEQPSDELKAICERHKAQVSFFEWIDDFAAARNFNMKQCTDEWYSWGDTDDVVTNMEAARPFLSMQSPDLQFVIAWYNYSFTATGKVAVRHPKERFIRNNGICTWKGRLHETCVSDGDSKGIRVEDIVWNHIKTGDQHKESSARNVRIIEAEIADQITAGNVDPRTVFNLGMAYASVAQNTDDPKDWESAMRAFQRYLTLSGYDQHAYMAWKYVGICQLKLSRPELALQSFVEALLLQPGYSDAYAMLGSAYEQLNDDNRAEHWHKLALVAGVENQYASDVETSTVTSLFALASIAGRRGKYKAALKYLKEARKYVGDTDPAINGMTKELRAIEKIMLEAEKIIARLDKLPVDERRPEFEKLEQRWKSHPQIVAWRRMQNWKRETNGKEITIFGTSWEPWNPDMAKTGIGGSEEATIYLAQELKARGWTVNVYGNHGDMAKEYDGVTYRPWWEWSPEEPCDIFISWRDPNLFEHKINAKKRYLWLHDTNPSSQMTEKRLAQIDKVIVLSKYHRSLYPNVPESKIMVSANGIIPSHFEVEGIERNPHKVLYTSAPNRGLKCLLEMWPKIREQVPDAELYWAYGWNTFDLMQKNNPNAKKFKEEIVALMNQPGVIDLGRIGHEELAKHMLSGGVWAYPTEFTEIFCITAVKMQAAGCVPVCTTVAALDEVVQFGHKFDVQDMYKNQEAQEQFIAKVVEYMNNPPDRAPMMDWARKNWTWGKVADQWTEEFSK